MRLSGYFTLLREIPESHEPGNYSFYVLSVYSLGLGFLLHLVFLGLFLSLNVRVMALVNAGSCIAYLLALYLNEKGRQPLSLAIFSCEILAHSLLASAWIGWASGFHLYILVIGLALFLYYRLPLGLKILFGVAAVAVYIAAGFLLQAGQPVIGLPASVIRAVFFMNVAFMFIALALMGYFFGLASVGFAKALNIRLAEVRNKNLIIESRQRQMDENMALARAIQRNVLPADKPAGDGLEFGALYLPADELGGDLYDFIEFPGSARTGIFISDVSGHGVPAALIVGMVKILLNTAAGVKSSPPATLEYINSHLRGLTVNRFITAFYGVYDRETRRFDYARAAHNYPLLLRKGQAAPVPLKSRGPVIGIFEDVRFEQGTVGLEEGDKIVFYTDGLIDVKDGNGAGFEERFMRLLEENRDTPVKTLVATVSASLREFLGKDRKIEDDICLVAMEILREP